MKWPEFSQWSVEARQRILRQALLALVFFLYIAFFFPFWKAIAAGVIFACGCSPLVTWLRQKMNLRRTSSSYLFLVFTSTFLLVALGLFFTSIYSFISDIAKNNSEFLSTDFNQMVTAFEQKIIQVLGLTDSNLVQEMFDTVKKAASNFGTLVTGFAQGLLQSVPDFLLDLFIFFLVYYGIIIYRGKIWAVVCELLGIEGTDVSLIGRFETMCARTLSSIFIVGIIQSVIVIIGIYFSHSSESYLFLFNVVFLFSLIPVLGAAIIPAFMSIASFINGDATAGIILLVTAGIAGSIDNILKGVLFSKASNSNPLLSLIALLGSLVLFGFIGLFLAPLFEQIIMAYLEYRREHKMFAKNQI